MKSKICSEHYVRTTTKGFLWIPVLLAAVFLMAFPVAEMMKLGAWEKLKYTSDELALLYENLWQDGLLTTGFVGAAIAGIVCSVSQFWYLYSAKKVDFYHSLPVRRGRLFALKTLVGVCYYLIPYAAMEFLTICIGAARGFFSLHLMGMALKLLALHFLLYLLVYFTTALMVILTGNILTGALCLTGLCFYGPVAAFILSYYQVHFFQTSARILQYGLGKILLQQISPLTLGWFFCTNYTEGTAAPLLVEIAIVTVLAALAGYAAYLRRPSEAAGRALVFSFTQVIVRLLVAVPFSFFVGEIFLSISGSSSESVEPWWIFGLIFGLLLAHGGLEVLYTQNFRKFFSHRLQLLISGGLVFLAAANFQLDLLGFDSYIPEADQIQEIRVSMDSLDSDYFTNIQETDGRYKLSYSNGSYYYESISSLGFSEELYQTLQEVVQKNPELTDNSCVNTAGYATVAYVLKSGQTVYRSYVVDSGSDRSLLAAAYREGTYKQQKYSSLKLDSSYLYHVSGYSADGMDTAIFSEEPEKRKELLEAFQKDIEEADAEVLTGQPCAKLTFDFKDVPAVRTADSLTPQSKGLMSFSASFYVFPEFTRTLEILEEAGYYQTISDFSLKKAEIRYYVTNTDNGSLSYTYSDPVTYDSEEELAELSKALVHPFLTVPWLDYSSYDIDSIHLEFENPPEEDYSEQYVLLKENYPAFITEDLTKAKAGEYGENQDEDDDGEIVAEAVSTSLDWSYEETPESEDSGDDNEGDGETGGNADTSETGSTENDDPEAESADTDDSETGDSEAEPSIQIYEESGKAITE